MMLRACLTMLLVLLTLSSAGAQISRNELAGVGIADRRGAVLPDVTLHRRGTLGERGFRDTLAGRPALLLLVDYTCASLCGVTLDALSHALSGTKLRIKIDYNVLVVGFDPNDGLRQVEAFRDRHLAPSVLVSEFEFLRGSREAIELLASSVGFSSKYDELRDQFAHPAAVIVTTSNGRISRTLDPLALNPLDLRLALTEAGQGRIGTLADRVALLCYGWDAATGIYTLQIRRILMLSGIATALLLIGGIAALHYREWLAIRRARRG